MSGLNDVGSLSTSIAMEPGPSIDSLCRRKSRLVKRPGLFYARGVVYLWKRRRGLPSMWSSEMIKLDLRSYSGFYISSWECNQLCLSLVKGLKIDWKTRFSGYVRTIEGLDQFLIMTLHTSKEACGTSGLNILIILKLPFICCSLCYQSLSKSSSWTCKNQLKSWTRSL